MKLQALALTRRSPLGVVFTVALMAGACALMLGTTTAEARTPNEPGVVTEASVSFMDESTGTYDNDAHASPVGFEAESSASTHGEQAWAYASLAGGLMRISGSATPVTPEHPEEPFHRTGSSAWAVAALYDNLIIDAPDMIPQDGLGAFMPWSVTIDGAVSGSTGVYFGYYFGDDDWQYVRFDGGAITVEGDFVLHPGQNIVPFGMSIQGSVGYNSQSSFAQGGNFDLSHTVRVHFNPPPELQVTSSSGVFPVGPTAPVPEPGTAWLAGAGLVGLLLRRRATPSIGGRSSAATALDRSLSKTITDGACKPEGVLFAR